MSEFETDIHNMQDRAERVAELYRLSNKEAGLVDWGPREYTEGFVGDVGDLTKLVMAKGGLREIPDVDRKLGHEIGDCFWSLLVICKQLGIDPAQAFSQTMDELEERLS